MSAEHLAAHLDAIGAKSYVSGGMWKWELTDDQLTDLAARVQADAREGCTPTPGPDGVPGSAP